MWQRILESNVNGKLFRVVYNMYDAAKSCIKVGNNWTKVFHCKIGVRHGKNLSPVQFVMLINEFNNNIICIHNTMEYIHLYTSYPTLVLIYN